MPTIETKYLAPVASGGDYSTLALWNSAEAEDLVYTDKIKKLRCAPGDYGTDSLISSAWTTASGNYIEIYGDKRLNLQNLNYERATRFYGSSPFTTSWWVAHIRLADAIFEAESSNGGAYIGLGRDSDSYVWGKRCIFRSNSTRGIRCDIQHARFYMCEFDGVQEGFYTQATNSWDLRFYNCVAMAFGPQSVGQMKRGFNLNKTGVENQYNRRILKNCYAGFNTQGNSRHFHEFFNYVGVSGTNVTMEACAGMGSKTLVDGVFDASAGSNATLSGIKWDRNNFENFGAANNDYPIVTGYGGDDYGWHHAMRLTSSGHAQMGQRGVDLLNDADFLSCDSADWFMDNMGVARDVEGSIMGTNGSGWAIGLDQYHGDELRDIHMVYLGGYAYTTTNPSWAKIAYLGGVGSGRGVDRIFYVGGYAKGEDSTTLPRTYLGGYGHADVWFTPDVVHLGGHVTAYSGLAYTPKIGGYSFGRPASTKYAELRQRMLVKARSDDVSDQTLDVDGKIIFMRTANADFYGKFAVKRTFTADFYGRLKVEKYHTPPTVFFSAFSVDNGVASGAVNNLIGGSRTVTISGSGYLTGDGRSWEWAAIDFGDPNFAPGAGDTSISGFDSDPTWTASHTYTASGLYTIRLVGIDNYGMYHTDSMQLNIASGLTAGTDYPAISISGTPRSGYVPGDLVVNFTASFSGVGAITADSSDNLIWNFGQGETSNNVNPSGTYSDPGFYIPVLRYHWTNANGNAFNVSDSLLVGWNN